MILVLVGCKSNETQENPVLTLCKPFNFCKVMRVIPCDYNNSIIYHVEYACEDVGVSYFDSNLSSIASCGGFTYSPDPEICHDLIKGCKNNTNICK
jgi:hypothetical protein